MSVDYSANFGIGFKVRHPQSNEKLDNEYDGDFVDFFYQEIAPLIEKKEEFQYFEVGEGSYDGTENEIYVTIKGGLAPMWDQALKKCVELKTFLWSLDLISLEDQADIVGGLEVY
jgi:hypothetical protein